MGDRSTEERVMAPKVLEIFTIQSSRAHGGWQLIHRGDGNGAKGA
jgi:hypothetical protein